MANSGVNKEQARFFSVKNSCTIGGSQYRPSICYAIPESLSSTIFSMAESGAARLYASEVRFVSGVAWPLNGAPQAFTASAVVAASSARITKKNGKA